MIKQRHHFSWVRAAALITLAGVLVWQVVTRSFAAYLAVRSPEVALKFHSTEPSALISLADELLNRPLIEGSLETAGVSRQASDDKSETSEDGRDRLGAWAKPELKGAAKNLPSGQYARAKKRDAKPKLAPPPVAEADRTQVRSQAEWVLIHDPLNARALRILGQLAHLAGDKTKAAQFMQAAVHRSWSESIAVYWLMINSFENGDYTAALHYADAFLRKRPQFMAQAAPTLVRLAENKDEKAVGALKTLLIGNPPWRSSFFSELPGAISDARTPLELFLSVKDTASPPTDADLRGYLNFLIGRKFHELAYYTWLQFLPPEELSRAGLLANGSFELMPSGLPFDWVISPGSSGVTTDIALRPDLDGEHALYLEFGPGRADFRGVSQILMLAPGAYELKGQYKGEIIGRRGLQWSIKCAGAQPQPIGESRMVLGLARTWTNFLIPFTVPESECRAQELRLVLAARSESERFVSGSIWYDGLQISRVEMTAEPPQTRENKPLNEEGRSPADKGTSEGTMGGRL